MAEGAYLEGLSETGKKSAWAETVRRKKVRPMIFFYQISQTPQAEKLGLDEGDKTLLQLATLRTMGLDAEANHLMKEKEPALKGEPLRLVLLTRVHQAVVSRSFDGVRAARKAFRDRRFDDENREEAKILTVAEKIDETMNDLVAKAEADAKAKAAAEAQAKADEKKQPKGDKRAPAQDKPGVDAVPEAK